MLNVSSGFISTAARTNAPWKRKLIIGGSDYSDSVTQWPKISRTWNAINPTTVTIDLSNAAQTFNFFLADPSKLHTSCSLQMGFDYAASSSEYLTLFAGGVDALRYADGGCQLTIIDKFRKLSDRLIGSTTTPTNYTSSGYLVHDMAWYVCTSMGGLDATANSSNPDIDYQSWASWSSVFSADNIRVKASYTGQKAIEALQKLAALTRSAIWVENNKIKFARFTISDSAQTLLTADQIESIDTTLDDRSLVNRFYVGAAYDVNSRTFGITVSAQSSDSQSRYGLREDSSMETVMWLVDSVSALGLAQRAVLTGGELNGQFVVRTPLQSIASTIGDVISLTDAHLQVDDLYRQLSETIDMDTGTKETTMDQTQFFNAFKLDVSALDSSDVLV